MLQIKRKSGKKVAHRPRKYIKIGRELVNDGNMGLKDKKVLDKLVF